MKIKTDFITNSSSVAFILSVDKNFSMDYFLIKNNFFLNKSDDSRIREFTEIECLIEETQNEECDWIDRIRGPRDFWTLGPQEYDYCKFAISKGKKAVYLEISRNYYDRFDRFINLVEKSKDIDIVGTVDH
jgi:hypothetical protein